MTESVVRDNVAAGAMGDGGGIMLADSDCTSAWVAEEIPALFAHPDRLAGMRSALAGVARLDAATVLASRVLEVIR